MSAAVQLLGVGKRFGEFVAVDDVSLEVKPGEFLTLLGPSGCGKTTLLRLIAGFETPTSGTIRVGGEDVTLLPPYRRPVNQVFQSYALFPHLTVEENVRFGLRMQRVPKAEADRRVQEALELVALPEFGRRRPQQLSGGQKQRVALARAIVCQPRVLLLDEPLSALDARLRQTMQLELKQMQRRLGITFLFVTHDQEEALTMSDRIAIINRGRIEQVGSAHEIYHRPATSFAAEFVGAVNLLPARMLGRDAAGVRVRLAGGLDLLLAAAAWPQNAEEALVSIRPEKIHVARSPQAGPNCFEARIEEEVFKGATDHLKLVTGTGTRLLAVVANESALGDVFHVGDRIYGALHADDLVVLPSKPPATRPS